MQLFLHFKHAYLMVLFFFFCLLASLFAHFFTIISSSNQSRIVNQAVADVLVAGDNLSYVIPGMKASIHSLQELGTEGQDRQPILF